ncbi:MAG TPA: class I SAM-dependent methyltransferase [Flavobacteriales bacterium]|nr:class I SAM-dependent methyltransferase [Flavobacteriales bacterium]HRE73824.1 class I SAM-dependent methyltransferase [Flavobacteriales bacterium]HRJ38518.1 class I SAM-dependent methyltransferase [Flavobacteriales bacterium]
MLEKFKSAYRFLSSKYQSIHLDYRVNPKPRYGHGNPPHKALYDSINGNRKAYEELLRSFLKYDAQMHTIQDASLEKDQNKPAWNNGFLPGLDIVGIYGMIAEYKPAKYIEIGSGNSTKVARKSITENHLKTEIISIDPFPRAAIDHLADRVIREPFENLSDSRFIVETLNENDILFIDNSHRVFPNSDAMICFLELLPFLKKGVIVHIHDIYLPYDYPQFMCDRYYNEQYMLAAFILANPDKYKTLLPNYFISEDPALAGIISPLWNHPNMCNVEKHGGSYWLQMG